MVRVRKRYIVLLLLALAVPLLGGYFACYQRAHMSVAKDGWFLDFSYIRVGCPVCLGRVEQLTCHDQPVPDPRLPANATDVLTLFTPVGRFDTRGGWKDSRAYAVGEESFTESGEPLTPAELAQGYYDVPDASDWPPPRRPGTPAHWCFASYGGIMRWLDPAIIGTLDWSQPTTAPANAAP